MRIRIKFENRRTNLTLLDEATVHDLVVQISEDLALDGGDLWISLNGREKLDEPTRRLVDCGIVNGDLIKVFTDDPDVLVRLSALQERPALLDNNDALYNANVASHLNTFSFGPEKQNFSTSANELTGQAAVVGPHTHATFNREDINKYLDKPVLCRECTDTELCDSLLQAMGSTGVPNTLHEAVFVALHVMMVETGFTEENVPNKWFLPSTWNQSPSKLCTEYTYLSGSEVRVTLLGVPLGGILVIHGLMTNNECKQFTAQLQVNDYVNKTDVYTNLPKLSRIFKDAIAYQLYVTVRNELGYPRTGLLGLMPEIKVRLLKCLDLPSLLKIAVTCEEFRDLSRDPTVWRVMYLKDFGAPTNCNLDQDWKKLYREKYTLMRQSRKRTPFLVPPEFLPHNPAHPFAPGPPRYPPGFIGGDYDLNPGFQGLHHHVMPGHRLVQDCLVRDSTRSVLHRLNRGNFF